MSKQSFTKLKTLVGISLISLCLASCTSKEQALKEREATMEKFVTAVTQNVFDRNPATIKQSMNTLTREQLSEKALNKLQSAHEIPETELDVLKIIDENQTKHKSNTVLVGVVRPLGPVEKDPVTFKVTGRDTPVIDGKPGDYKTFSIEVTCTMSDEMGGYPRCTDVTGLTSAKSFEPETPDKTSKSAHKKHH